MIRPVTEPPPTQNACVQAASQRKRLVHLGFFNIIEDTTLYWSLLLEVLLTAKFCQTVEFNKNKGNGYFKGCLMLRVKCRCFNSLQTSTFCLFNKELEEFMSLIWSHIACSFLRLHPPVSKSLGLEIWLTADCSALVKRKSVRLQACEQNKVSFHIHT